ncbi:MAG TPA: 4-alpha-glucanotransferase, partial [Saprospiraceae bacterium]|nr:4-alpha-glucanotransferase [Saprospiraceae bacterium]
MKVHFILRYRTRMGESCLVSLNQEAPQMLSYLNEDLWHGAFEVDAEKHPALSYQYLFQDAQGARTTEWEQERLLDLTDKKAAYQEVVDFWNPTGALENTFLTQPFQNIFNPPPPAAAGKTTTQPFTHVFKVKAPLLKAHEAVCLLGHGVALRTWDTAAPIVLKREGNWWTARLNLSQEDFPLGYKYGVWDTAANRFVTFEEGVNRTLYAPSAGQQNPRTTLHDGFIRLPNNTWKGAGVAIPVFSLRSEKSWGIGEFTDMPLLADWAKSVGLKMIQLLPINDTTATHTWLDSYPYSAITAFALHPIFLNVEQLAGKKHATVLKPYLKKRQELNALESVDYEAVLQMKWDIIRQLYDLLKADWLKDKAYAAFYNTNKHWLAPYAAFCWLRDANGTADFNQWTTHARYEPKEIEKLLKPGSESFDQIGLHLFVQWQLHLQLQAATDYCHQQGLAVKGDIPIGIYRYSCDAWMAPELYNMDQQAGAPPDDFAEKGQNWGFPTYNWERMKQDGFAWWKQRFEQMSLYFDAFRIDHILGFFRIWSIPLDAVEGILGQFVPAIPVTEEELRAAGVGFDFNRLCKPFINEQILLDTFGDAANWVAENCLQAVKGGIELRPEFDTQRKVEQYFLAQKPDDRTDRIRNGLFSLISNVVLLTDAQAEPGHWKGAFRFSMEKTTSYQYLPEAVKGPLQAMYVDYFYRRQDDFWREQAMEKLPALKRSTNMLICGEDLGMVPHCVPDVMNGLGILSLEIQRMPKASGAAFFHPKDAPYRSVVTPSTHDMSTLRGWWEENRKLSQRFFNEILGYHGTAPYFCEPWVNRAIILQHFQSPAMWSIFQLQDLLGSDEKLRRENPNDERINIPAVAKHYWRYRMHLSLEALLAAEKFNADLG